MMVLRTPEPTAPAPLALPVTPAPRPSDRSRIEPVTEDRWQWRIGMNGERKAKLDRLRRYLGHKIPDGNLEKMMNDEPWQQGPGAFGAPPHTAGDRGGRRG